MFAARFAPEVLVTVSTPTVLKHSYMTTLAACQRCSITVPSPTALKHSHMTPLDARQRCLITVPTPKALKHLNWIKSVGDCNQAIPRHHRDDWVTVVDSFAALAH